jgi:hypothetical protein
MLGFELSINIDEKQLMSEIHMNPWIYSEEAEKITLIDHQKIKVWLT